MSGIQVRHNPDESRFEAKVAGGTAIVEYERHKGQIELTHTEVPDEAAGQGVAQALVVYALDYARKEKLRVIPSCTYVAAYVKKHPEYNDIIDAA